MMDINTGMPHPPTAGISISHDGLPKLAAVHCYDRGNIATFPLKNLQCNQATKHQTPYVGSSQTTMNQKVPLKRPSVNQTKIYSGEYYPAGSQPRLQIVGGRPVLLPSTYGNKFIPKTAFNPDINHSKSIIYNDPILNTTSCEPYTAQDTRLKFHDSSSLGCTPDGRYPLHHLKNSERKRSIDNYLPPGVINQLGGSQSICPEETDNSIVKSTHHNPPVIDLERHEMMAKMNVRTPLNVDSPNTAINENRSVVSKSYNNLVHSNGINNNQINESCSNIKRHPIDQQQHNKELYSNNISGQGSINPYNKETNSAILNDLSNRLNERQNCEDNFVSLLKTGTIFRCNWCQNKLTLENSHTYIDDTLKTSSAYKFNSTLLCKQCAKNNRVWNGMKNVSSEHSKLRAYDNQLHENGVSSQRTESSKSNNVHDKPICIDLEDACISINGMPGNIGSSNTNPSSKGNYSTDDIGGKKIIPTWFYNKHGIYDDNGRYFPDSSRSPHLPNTSNSVTPWKKYKYTKNLTPNLSRLNSGNARKTPIVIDLERLDEEEHRDVVKPRERVDTSRMREKDDDQSINIEISDSPNMSPKNSNVKENPSNHSIRKEEMMNHEKLQIESESDIKELNMQVNDDGSDPNNGISTMRRNFRKCNTSSDIEKNVNGDNSTDIRTGETESNTASAGNTGKKDKSKTNELHTGSEGYTDENNISNTVELNPKRKLTCEHLVLNDANTKICDRDIDEESIKSTLASPTFQINKEQLQNDKSNPSLLINKDQLEKLRNKVLPILKAKKWIRENSSDCATAELSQS